jgi:site-specific recombinase XerD
VNAHGYSDFVKLFTEYLKDQRGFSQHTIRNYENDLKQFHSFLVKRGAL